MQKESKTNDLPYEVEPSQTCCARIKELSPLVMIVLRSKAKKQVIDITAMAFTIMNREGFCF